MKLSSLLLPLFLLTAITFANPQKSNQTLDQFVGSHACPDSLKLETLTFKSPLLRGDLGVCSSSTQPLNIDGWRRQTQLGGVSHSPIHSTTHSPRWQNLFNGRNLNNWTQKGGAALYTIEDNAIVGTTTPNTPNSFLCTKKFYDDFILEYEFKVDPALNSGVQIRSNSYPEYQNSRVHGYQIEIDPSDRAWTAGIYDEARRGWLNDLTQNPAAQKAFKQNQWNHVRVLALGSTIKTWLNGVPAADLNDNMTSRGFIALQVHASNEPNPLQVRWRNLRILEISTEAMYQLIQKNQTLENAVNRTFNLQPLLEGNDLSAWRSVKGDNVPPGWKLDNGILEIVPGQGSIVSKKNVRDFYLRLEFNIDPLPDATGQAKGNSGIYIQRRYEIQILDSFGIEDYTSGDCGSIYRTRRPDVNASLPAGQWQSFHIIFRAPRWDNVGNKTENAKITVWHNDKLIHENVEIPNKTGAGQPEAPTNGPIELQDHGNVIKFRNIELVEVIPNYDDAYQAFCFQFGAQLILTDLVIDRQNQLDNTPGAKMKFGLVTYLWGRDWDLPTLLKNCQTAGIQGVELRTTHAHGVEPNLTAELRQEIKKLFDQSPVTLVGPGSDENLSHVNPADLEQAMESYKKFLKLSFDLQSSGVKLKPNDLPPEVPREQTIRQIGQSLNTLGEYAATYGQQIRLEAHGACAPLPIMKQIMDIADHPNVALCWNCNPQDLQGQGLEYNFNLVQDRLGDTLHVRELDSGSYPYQQLINLLVALDYDGWILLEAHGPDPQDRVADLTQQRKLFEQMRTKAQQQLKNKSFPLAPDVKSGDRIANQDKVVITNLNDKIKVEIDGKLFTEYNYQNVPRPFFYPVIGPTGDPVTRNYPMAEAANEEQDHPHHRSLWFTHGSVNGHDFWAEDDRSGKIVHDKFLKIESGPESGVIQTSNKWIARNGQLICTDTRTHTFHYEPNGIIMDFDVTIHASKSDMVLGDTKEGSMALRLAPTMRLKGKVAQGHILNSKGLRDSQTWGKRADWCDYYGPVNGQTVGVAIFDHPSNPRHPTWWHVRDYGLFAANPFGVHDFEGKPKGAGDLTIAHGKSATFRYRIYFHPGDTNQGLVADHFRNYVASAPDF